jgi:hypothetical protein
MRKGDCWPQKYSAPTVRRLPAKATGGDGKPSLEVALAAMRAEQAGSKRPDKPSK